jgi:CRP/FNR family transcriptional regulator, cyclic AMP receptor protein
MAFLSGNAKIDILKGLPLFDQCSKTDLREIVKLTDEIDFREGRVLMREGERGREFYVVLEGTVEVTRDGKKLATLGAGAMIGEMALVSDKPRSATVTAGSSVHLLVLTENRFRRLLAQHPSIQTKVMKSLADRLAATVE